MNKKVSQFLLLLFLVAIAGLFVYKQNLRSSNIDNVVDEPTVTSNLGTPNDAYVGWNRFDAKIFSFYYPSEATAEERQEESVVYFMGPKQIASGRTQTELFDGYSFRVGVYNSSIEGPLEEIAISDRDNAETGCDGYDGVVSEIENVFVSETAGFQYWAKGCYVDYTNTFVEHDGAVYLISMSYVGDSEDVGNYYDITKKMLSSLEFVK